MMPQSAPAPPASRYHSRRIPAVQQLRQAACTHLNVTRLFDPLNGHKCHMCGHPSPFGWLYRCTQDYHSFLPESDFSANETEIFYTPRSEHTRTDQLSQSILKGIRDGQYSLQQMQLLQTQKSRVKELVAMYEEGLEDQSESSYDSSGYSSSESAPENTESIAANNSETSSNTSLDHRAAAIPAYNQQTSSSLTPPAPAKKHAKPVILRCDFKCCPACRPAYRDRAFQSLAAIVAEPFQPPPEWELKNRRLSDARLLSRIATPSNVRQLRHMDQTFDDLRHLTTSQTWIASEDEEAYSAVDKSKRKIRRRTGFGDTMKKAFQVLEHSKQATKPSKDSSKSSNRESVGQTPRSMLFRRRVNQGERKNKTVSTRALRDSLVLMVAINTPLPRASEDSCNLEGGEVKVEDGVAVTEEGVEMSAADIILQV